MTVPIATDAPPEFHPPRNAPPPSAGSQWSTLELLAFRFVFVYFAMFAVTSLLDSGPAPRRVLAWIDDVPIRWLGNVVLRLDGSPSLRTPAWVIVQLVFFALAAAAGAVVWSLLSPKREHPRLQNGLRIALRYYVAVIMMVYGAFKVINSQFPPPSLEQVTRPLGALTPMGLLWVFMGYSPVYMTFTGLGETIGAFLLFFRKTTTLGALILIAVLSNVALLNYTFDVPVKQLSTNLLFACVVLAAFDWRRIVDLLVLNRPTAPRGLSPAARGPRARLFRRIVKPIIVVGATVVPLVVSFVVHGNITRVGPLFGVYDVESFVRNGVAVPPLVTDGSAWRSVVFGRAGSLMIRRLNDSVSTFAVSVDTVGRTLGLTSRGGESAAMAFSYAPLSNGGLRLMGRELGDSLVVTLRRLDHERTFRLLRR